LATRYRESKLDNTKQVKMKSIVLEQNDVMQSVKQNSSLKPFQNEKCIYNSCLQ